MQFLQKLKERNSTQLGDALFQGETTSIELCQKKGITTMGIENLRSKGNNTSKDTDKLLHKRIDADRIKPRDLLRDAAFLDYYPETKKKGDAIKSSLERSLGPHADDYTKDLVKGISDSLIRRGLIKSDIAYSALLEYYDTFKKDASNLEYSMKEHNTGEEKDQKYYQEINAKAVKDYKEVTLKQSQADEDYTQALKLEEDVKNKIEQDDIAREPRRLLWERILKAREKRYEAQKRDFNAKYEALQTIYLVQVDTIPFRVDPPIIRLFVIGDLNHSDAQVYLADTMSKEKFDAQVFGIGGEKFNAKRVALDAQLQQCTYTGYDLDARQQRLDAQKQVLDADQRRVLLEQQTVDIAQHALHAELDYLLNATQKVITEMTDNPSDQSLKDQNKQLNKQWKNHADQRRNFKIMEENYEKNNKALQNRVKDYKEKQEKRDQDRSVNDNNREMYYGLRQQNERAKQYFENIEYSTHDEFMEILKELSKALNMYPPPGKDKKE